MDNLNEAHQNYLETYAKLLVLREAGWRDDEMILLLDNLMSDAEYIRQAADFMLGRTMEAQAYKIECLYEGRNYDPMYMDYLLNGD